MGRTALVLGAGLGGISPAQSLRKVLPHDDRVVLVDRAGDHVYQASLPWVLAGSRDLAQISRPAERAASDESAYDLLFYAPPHRAPAVIREAGLTDESGWIPVDRHTLATQYDGVYAIGDVVVLPLKMGRPCKRLACLHMRKAMWSRTMSPWHGPDAAHLGASTAWVRALSKRATVAPAWDKAISTRSLSQR